MLKLNNLELLVQDGGVEGRVLISSCESTKIATSCWTAINRRTLEPTKKRYPTFEDKEAQQDGRRGAIMIKSNPIPARLVTHRLENNNTKQVLALLWRFWTSCQASQPRDLKKGTGNPQGIWPSGPEGFYYRPSTGLGETDPPVVEGTNKILHAPRPRGEEQWPHRRLKQNYLLVLEAFLWKRGSAGARHRDRGTGRSPLE